MKQLFTLTTIAFLLTLSFQSRSQCEVDNTLAIETYVNDILLGTGIAASNITYTGSPVQIGHMTNGAGTGFPMTEGLVLSSADATNIAFPDGFGMDVPFGEGVSGDADLLEIANSVPGLIGQSFSVSSVNDLCILEFDFLAAGDSVKFNYSFGSDEYLEWVNSSFNDIFAFFLSGPGIVGPYDSPAAFPDGAVNIAQLPDTDPPMPITISSVNDQINEDYYIDNPNPDDEGFAQDGFTVKLVAEHEVICGETYHIKLAIGDGSDTALESIVVLEAGSFESNAVVEVDLSINVGGPDANTIYEDCGEAVLNFTRPIETILEVEEMVIISYTGTAINGVDYTLLPDSVIFPPFVETVSLPIDAFEDGLVEGLETVQLEILNLAACNGDGLTSYFEFFIDDEPDPLVVDGYTTTICQGDTLDIAPIITGGYGNFTYDWSNGETTATQSVYPDATETYNVIVSDTCGMPSDDADITVEILVFPPLEISIDQGDIELSCGESIELSATTTGGDGVYEWGWEDEDGNNLWGWLNTLWYSTWSGADQIVVSVTDGCGFEATDVIDVTLDVPALSVETEEDLSVFCNDPFTMCPTVIGGEGPFFYNWYEGGAWIGWEECMDWSTSEDLTLTFEVTDNCGQTEDVDINIVVDSPPVVVELPETLEGPCTEIFDLTADVISGSGGYSYTWTNNGDVIGTSESIDFNSFGSTAVTVVVEDNCSGEGEATVNINIVNPPLEIEIGEDINASCVDNTDILVDILSGSGGYEYSWTVGQDIISTDEAIELQSFTTTPVQVYVTDGCGGEATDDLLYIIPDIPLEIDISQDESICYGDGISISSLAGGGEEGFVYFWPSLGAYGADQYITPDNSASYTVIATDICGETVSADVFVEVIFLFSDFTASYLDETQVQFYATPEPECIDCQYFWNFGDGATSEEENPLHTYDGLSEYDASLTVTDIHGCTDSSYTTINAPPILYIPNAFTPNNDGVNDVFQVQGSQLLRYEMVVFNRWGEVVFYSENVSDIWNGSHQGSEHYVPNGNYNYVVRAKGINTDAFERIGTVTVMR